MADSLQTGSYHRENTGKMRSGKYMRNLKAETVGCHVLVVVWLLLAAAEPVRAQVGEERRALAMGINGGLSFNSVSFDPTIKQSMYSGPTLGITLRMTSEKYFSTLCALQVELNYTLLGWKENIMSAADEPLPDAYQRNLSYLQLPVLARLGWGREQRGMMGYLLAGPQIGYLLGESTKRSLEWTLTEEGVPDRPNGMYAQYGMPVEKKIDYGITAGVGIELNSRIGHFMLDVRYYYGLSDLYGNSKKDVFSRSNNGTIMIKFSYLFDIRK